MTRPFFSIVTCTRNSEEFLSDNINSVELQTFKDYEHIFIDGFSSDKTTGIIKSYQKKDKNRVFFFQFPAKGISDAFNKGILKGRGQWIVFLNSDDCFYDRSVLNSVHDYLLKNTEVKIVYGKSVFLNELGKGNKNRRVIPHRKIYRKLRFWLIALTNYIPHQSVFMHRDLFLKCGGFDEKLNTCQDYEMWFRLSKNRVSNGYIDRKLSIFRYRKDAATQSPEHLSVHYKILKKYIKNSFLLLFLKTIHRLNLQRVFFE
jgi:glycosyltransferase involved in cell wall biosynthesis